MEPAGEVASVSGMARVTSFSGSETQYTAKGTFLLVETPTTLVYGTFEPCSTDNLVGCMCEIHCENDVSDC